MSIPAAPDKEAVLLALEAIIDPVSGKGLSSAGLVQGLVVGPGRAGFMLEAPASQASLYAPVREAAERVLRGLPGIEKAQVVLTAMAGSRAGAPHRHDPNRGPAPYRTSPTPGAEPPPEPGVTRVRKGARINEDPQARPSPVDARKPDHVRNVVAIASGKGGVGKSTVAVSLAMALSARGLSVGLLDADVYGPSAPTLLGVDEEPAYEDGKLTPLLAHGLKVMSIGFLVDAGSPMIWRGPMASSAVRQMAGDVRWGTEAAPLDVLVVDLPPGTGDIHLTLVQKLAVDGVVIVTTPSELALIDVRRAAAMFAKTGTPIWGVIDNMAYFPDPATGARIAIFGEGGGKAEAARLGAPVLAEIPIDIALRSAGDAGMPLAVTTPGSPIVAAFAAAADGVAVRLA